MEDDDLNCSFGDEDFGIGNSTFNSVLLNESVDTSFEVENEGLNPETSTPKKAGKAKAGAFKIPKPPPSVYFKKCAFCGNYLKTERGYNGHIQRHKWKDNALLRPPVAKVIQHCKAEAPALLEKLVMKFSVQEGQPGHLLSVKITSVLRDLKCSITDSEFLECVLDKVKNVLSSKKASTIMPSALRPVIQSGLSEAYSHKHFRDKLLEYFMELTPAPPDLAWNIIYCFCKEMFDAAFIYVCKVQRGPAIERSQVQCKDDFNHLLSQSVVHQAAGSALRTHFRDAYVYPNNQYMRNVKECILLKFAKIGCPSIVDRKNPQYWTALLNRKALLFLHEEALPFFVELCKILQKLETADGVLDHERVMEKIVSERQLTTTWDCIVDNFLCEEESFRFMTKVVKSMTNTFGKGMMVRRMNARGKSGRGNKKSLGVGHRVRLIGKQ